MESNLDRFDTSDLLWRHPRFSRPQLMKLLYHCYQEFYAISDILTKSATRKWCNIPWRIKAIGIGNGFFSRYAAFREMHPMSGGIRRVFLDSVGNYLHLREDRYGFRLVPLPKSLQLSEADRRLNRVNAPLESEPVPA